MRPFLKWAGGKYRLIDKIREKMASGERLIEPFAGSCALSLNCHYQQFWLNDINTDLINLYKTIQSEGEAFIDLCRSFFVPENNSAERYYELREQFNRENNIIHKSALFLYLNRHGYNGLCRYNSKGEFNVPFGRYKNPYFPEKELKYFYRHFKNATFTNCDFENVMLEANCNDIVYCDPPYVPLSATSNFTSFSTGGFSEDDQIRLVECARKLSEKGVTVIISNHFNEFTSQLYKDARIDIFPVQRFISCNGDNRFVVAELLAIF